MNDLSLPEFNILKKEGNRYDYLFTVELKKKPDFCIHCMWDEFTTDMFEDTKGFRFKVHETRERMVTDLDMHRKRVKIKILHKRYKCPLCGKTFFELMDSVDTNGKITKRLYEYLREESLEPFRTFTDIADDFGISSMTVRRAFDDYVEEHEKDRVLKAPRVIGIDEAHLNEIMRGVITDIENRRLLEVLPTNTKRDVKNCIKSMEGYKNIEIATMDMATGYRYTVYDILPNALVVVDKFHVVQYAQMALNSVRVAYKNKLKQADKKQFHRDKWLLQTNKEDLSEDNIIARDRILDQSEILMTAYWLKEMVRDLYTRESKRQAYEWFYQIEKTIPKDKEYKPFHELMKTYNNSKKEIFNYFDARYTNAYTESINNQIKRVEKSGMGYSFEVLRGKCLFGIQRPKKPRFGEKGFKKVSVVSVKD